MFWKVPQIINLGAFSNGNKNFHAFSQSSLKRASKTDSLAGMIGKFITERGENTKQNFVLVVVNSGRPMDDLPSCLTLRNVDIKRDEKQKKCEKTSEECLAKTSTLRLESLSPVAIPRHLTRKKNDVKPEIHIEGTSLNYQNFLQETVDKTAKSLCVQSSQDEQAAGSSRDESETDGITMNTEERSLLNTPESVNISGDCVDQDIEVSILGSAKAQRSLNPSPWKEVWSVLQDRSLANCPLSTKSMEFGRDISETPFSIRSNPYTKPRREKPQRIPPLYNTRKTIPIIHGKAKVPSFDAAVTFNTFFKGDQDTRVAFDIAKGKECVKLADFKDHSLQRERSGVHTCGKHDGQKTEERTIGLPNITCPATDRYKSKFRVKLLPLVTKSDSLPNLTSKSTSAPSELIVTAPNIDAKSSENIDLDCSKNDEMRNDLVDESVDLKNKCRQNRSMSLDSVFSVQSFAAYQGEKSAIRKINVQGFQVLPDVKHTEPKKCSQQVQQPLKQNVKEAPSGIPRQTAVITLPWKCN